MLLDLDVTELVPGECKLQQVENFVVELKVTADVTQVLLHGREDPRLKQKLIAYLETELITKIELRIWHREQ